MLYIIILIYIYYIIINIGVIDSSDLMVLHTKHYYECNFGNFYLPYNKISEPILSFLNFYIIPCLNYSEYYILFTLLLIILILAIIKIRYIDGFKSIAFIIFIALAEIPTQSHLMRQFIATYIIIIIFSMRKLNIFTGLLALIAFGIHNGGTVLSIFYCLLFFSIKTNYNKKNILLIWILIVTIALLYQATIGIFADYFHFLNQPNVRTYETAYIDGIVKYFWLGLLFSIINLLIINKGSALLYMSIFALMAYYFMSLINIHPESAFRVLLPLRYVLFPLLFSDLIYRLTLNKNAINYYNKPQ